MKLYKNSKVIHIPNSLAAFVIDAILLIFIFTVLIAANRSIHSVSDMFYAVFPYIVPAFLFREWLASKLD